MAQTKADEWIVVGGKGKPRQPKALIAATTCNQHLAHNPPAAHLQALPGWENAAASNAVIPYKTQSNSSRKKRQQRSPEQQIAYYVDAVCDCKREVRESAVFHNLHKALDTLLPTILSNTFLEATEQDQTLGSIQPDADKPANVACASEERAQEPNANLTGEEERPATSSTPQAPVNKRGVSALFVYGLGSVQGSRVSRYQLAMALLLAELLGSLTPHLYDPAFTDLDTAILQQLNCQVISEDERGRRRVSQPTLFYLPHCEAWLCDNLLGANWCRPLMSQLVILGNSFDKYRQLWEQRDRHAKKQTTTTPAPPTPTPTPTTTANILTTIAATATINGDVSGKQLHQHQQPDPMSRRRPDWLMTLAQQGAVVEVAVPEACFPVVSAFNDMSLHVFPRSKLDSIKDMPDTLAVDVDNGASVGKRPGSEEHCVDNQLPSQMP